MRAGDYRHFVTIQEPVETTDDLGQAVTTYRDTATVHAAVEPLEGRELFAAQAIHAEVTTRVRIRFRPGVTSRHRIVYGARIMNVLSVIDPEERHREIVMLCSEVR